MTPDETLQVLFDLLESQNPEVQRRAAELILSRLEGFNG